MPSPRSSTIPGVRPTQRGVAAHAGVSTATVSYVLNETPGQSIPVATRRRVLDAVAAVGYVPSPAGRALQRGHSRAVIVDVGDMEQSGPTLGRLLRGMSDELRKHEHVLLITVGGDAHSAHVRSEVSARSVLDLSTLTLGPASSDVISGVIDGTHAGFAYQSLIQLRYLRERGHRNIAFVLSAGPDAATVRTRREHVTAAARELGLPLPPTVRLARDGSAARALERLLETGVTAVAAYDDATALRLMSAVHVSGGRCPDDLAVMSFDDSEAGALWTPALSTLRINAEEYGRRAARLALGRELGPWATAPTAVIHRGST